MKKPVLNSWGTLVGKGIMAFGEIELVTYFCLASLPAENIFRTTASLSFNKRVHLILDIVENKEISPETKKIFKAQLNEALNLSQIRNLIAHNPLQMSVYTDDDGKTKIKQEISAYLNENKKISHAELDKFSKRSLDLSFELYETYSVIMRELGKESD